MDEYILNVEIDPYWVEYFNQLGLRFCFARSIQNGKSNTTRDVIAYAKDAEENIQVTWKEVDFMAASKTPFLNGIQVGVDTDVVGIHSGQKFTLGDDWKVFPKVNYSTDTPPDGFVFEATSPAAAVLYQKILDSQRPVYISPHTPLLSSSTESLTPLCRVGIWFQKDAQSGNMFTEALQKVVEVSMTTNTMTASYDSSGRCLAVKADNQDQKGAED